jgi:hypothetical protein
MSNTRREEALAIMKRFAERTGLDPEATPTRYLWTDAFAVCNWLGLAEDADADAHVDLALRLVEQVHRTLGRHRDDDPREGWISGLGEAEGRAHPTAGGLRIGKPVPERRFDEPFDERLEWDRDGQYFHYLTKWMHALDQCTRATGRWRHNTWGRELARAAYTAFTHETSSTRGEADRRIYWKMSIDLSRPLVPSMGLHDPLDGFVTYSQLASTASRMPEPAAGPSLHEEVAAFANMVEPSRLATADPLGIGGLLVDASRLAQLMKDDGRAHRELIEGLLASALEGLTAYGVDELDRRADQRLAFRELGLAIGLHALELTSTLTDSAAGERLLSFLPVRDRIESFWRDPGHWRAPTWTDHLDINEVMLATSLAPEGFLMLPTPPQASGLG